MRLKFDFLKNLYNWIKKNHHERKYLFRFYDFMKMSIYCIFQVFLCFSIIFSKTILDSDRYFNDLNAVNIFFSVQFGTMLILSPTIFNDMV